jgi:hypothetical protein
MRLSGDVPRHISAPCANQPRTSHSYGDTAYELTVWQRREEEGKTKGSNKRSKALAACWGCGDATRPLLRCCYCRAACFCGEACSRKRDGQAAHRRAHASRLITLSARDRAEFAAPHYAPLLSQGQR